MCEKHERVYASDNDNNNTESEKKDKYQDLARELKKNYGI